MRDLLTVFNTNILWDILRGYENIAAHTLSNLLANLVGQILSACRPYAAR